MWWAKSAPGSVNQGFRDRRIGKFGATLRLSGREKKFEKKSLSDKGILRKSVVHLRDYVRNFFQRWPIVNRWAIPFLKMASASTLEHASQNWGDLGNLYFTFVLVLGNVYSDSVLWLRLNWHWSLSTQAQTRLKTSIIFVFHILYFVFLFSLFVRFSVQAGGRTINCIKQ